MFYPATFTQASEGGFVVTFRDIPEAITQGDNEEEALNMAQDALITAFDFYFEDRRIIPLPSQATKKEYRIEVPPSIVAKVLLLNEMIKQHVKQAELARRMLVSAQEVQRLTNLSHVTKIDTINTALAELGKHLEIRAV